MSRKLFTIYDKNGNCYGRGYRYEIPGMLEVLSRRYLNREFFVK